MAVARLQHVGAPVARAVCIAKIPKLMNLNLSEVRPRERINAETLYLQLCSQDWALQLPLLQTALSADIAAASSAPPFPPIKTHIAPPMQLEDYLKSTVRPLQCVFASATSKITVPAPNSSPSASAMAPAPSPTASADPTASKQKQPVEAEAEPAPTAVAALAPLALPVYRPMSAAETAFTKSDLPSRPPASVYFRFDELARIYDPSGVQNSAAVAAATHSGPRTLSKSLLSAFGFCFVCCVFVRVLLKVAVRCA